MFVISFSTFLPPLGPEVVMMYEERKLLEKKKRIDIPFADRKYLSALGIMPCPYTLIVSYIY